MDRKTEQELREMIRKFLDLNPTDEQLEAFYINEVLPHDKRSIVEIMTRHLPHSNGVDCWACGKKIDGLDTRYIDSGLVAQVSGQLIWTILKYPKIFMIRPITMTYAQA